MTPNKLKLISIIPTKFLHKIVEMYVASEVHYLYETRKCKNEKTSQEKLFFQKITPKRYKKITI